MPFILPTEEAVLPLGFLACVLDFVLGSPLVAFAVVLLVWRPIILVRLLLVVLGRLLILLGVDIENLLVRASRRLVLTSAIPRRMLSVLGSSLLLELVLLFHSFVKVVVRPAVFLKLVVEFFYGRRFLPSQFSGEGSNAKALDGYLNCYFFEYIGCSCFELHESLIIMLKP